ncbi:MAG: hypothetical protein QF441_05500 [Bacteriovoracaceae bacterium]|jgi:hypothetical protein|nr:hypothetical protein [Bacteriovoracaceae bacterium]
MKRILGLMALTVMTSALGATSTTTSTSKTTLTQKSKSFTEKFSFWYFTELYSMKLTTDDNVPGDKKTDWVNYLNTSYEIDSLSSFNLTLRANITDRQADRGQGDRYQELDPRISYKRVLHKTATSSLRLSLTFEIPMSRYSDYKHGDQRITRFKPSLSYSKKIDDYNTILLFAGFNKTYYKQSRTSIENNSRHYITSWFSYVNSALSEKYKLRFDAEGVMRHNGGTSDLNIASSSGEERLLAGVNFDIAGLDMFPYIQHDPSIVKATNNLGGGIQVFKAF